MKEQEKNPKEMEISHLLDKEFKDIVVRMLTKLQSGIQEFKTTTKGKYNKGPSRSENTITEMTNTLERINIDIQKNESVTQNTDQ